jgi:hypothetical protein
MHAVVLRKRGLVQHQAAESHARLCLIALSQLQKSWPVCGWILRLFVSLLKRIAVDEGEVITQFRASLGDDFRVEKTGGPAGIGTSKSLEPERAGASFERQKLVTGAVDPSDAISSFNFGPFPPMLDAGISNMGNGNQHQEMLAQTSLDDSGTYNSFFFPQDPGMKHPDIPAEFHNIIDEEEVFSFLQDLF